MPAYSHVRHRAVRAAIEIHERLTHLDLRLACWQLPQNAWDELRRTARLLQLVQSRGWRVAARRLSEQRACDLRRLVRELDTLVPQEPLTASTCPVASPGIIAADLESLGQDFSQVEIELKRHTISLCTDPIELGGLDLGPFRIELDWNRLGETGAYKVIAIKPRQGGEDDQVTHPHVRSQQLCEGDGAAPIKSALRQGRIGDFFLIVRQILETYNAGSAYIPLDRWDGVICRDCGHGLPACEESLCERCDAALCGECSMSCPGCDRYVCASCSAECAACGSFYCESCLESVAGSAGRLCTSCLEQREREEDHEPQADDSTCNAPAPDGPGPAADSLHVGQGVATA